MQVSPTDPLSLQNNSRAHSKWRRWGENNRPRVTVRASPSALPDWLSFPWCSLIGGGDRSRVLSSLLLAAVSRLYCPQAAPAEGPQPPQGRDGGGRRWRLSLGQRLDMALEALRPLPAPDGRRRGANRLLLAGGPVLGSFLCPAALKAPILALRVWKWVALVAVTRAAEGLLVF